MQVKIIDAEKKEMSEAGQVAKIRFAMCKQEGEDFRCTHYWIMCRDFFMDVLMVRDGIRKNAGVYGFECTKDTYSPLIAVKHTKTDVTDELNSLIPGVTVKKCEDGMVYSLPPEWMENPILVSLSTGIMRLRSYKGWTEDDNILAKFLEKPDIAGIRELTEGWMKAISVSVPISTVHHKSGIVSFVQNKLWWAK